MARLTDCLDMTILVDLDVKQQTKIMLCAGPYELIELENIKLTMNIGGYNI